MKDMYQNKVFTKSKIYVKNKTSHWKYIIFKVFSETISWFYDTMKFCSPHFI